MTQRAGFKTVETDLEELEEKIHKHRRKVFTKVAIVVVIVIAVVIVAQLWMALRSYDSYEVKQTLEEGDKSAVSFTNFCGNIVEYSNDGIVYMDNDGELIWNQSFEMTKPVVAKCENYLTVYDENGTELFIIEKGGVKKQLETTMPIITACIAKQGTVAVLINEEEKYFVKLYDNTGKELASGEFFGEQGRIPIDIALSYDAKKLAVDMLDITKGKVDTTISFYNFGSVGQNEIDNNVGTYTYEGVMIPDITYVSDNKMLAIGDNKIMTFTGSQKPELDETIELSDEINDVFYCEKYIGIAYSNNDEDCTSHIKVFDMNANMVMENDTDIPYTKIDFNANNEVCVMNDYECEIYTVHSVKKFDCKFDTKIYQILYGSGVNDYIFVYEGKVDEVRLK